MEKIQQVVLSLIALAVILAVLRVAIAVVDALNDIPLLAPTFQLVGIGYSLWFVGRYLLFALNRQELGQSTQTVFHQQIKELGAGKKHQLSEEQEQSKQQSEIALASTKSGTANIADDRSEPELAVTNGEQSRANFETPARLVDEVASLRQQELTNQETEQDMATAQSQQMLYKPGEIVPTSGQYEVIGLDGVSQKREITSTKGEHFPPAPESGMHYRLVDATVHQGSQRLAQSVVVNSDETEQLYKPGEIVPISGQYQVINPDGVSQGREVTSTKGEHFPPQKNQECIID